MKAIFYAGDRFITSDDIASALLSVGKALASAHRAENVEIPVTYADGSIRPITVLLGPASQLVAESVEIGADELHDDVAVTRLRQLERQLLSKAVVPDEDAPRQRWSDSLD
jgi:hypothetical protein